MFASQINSILVARHVMRASIWDVQLGYFLRLVAHPSLQDEA